jgi:hypothetical protein
MTLERFYVFCISRGLWDDDESDKGRQIDGRDFLNVRYSDIRKRFVFTDIQTDIHLKYGNRQHWMKFHSGLLFFSPGE